MRPTSGDRTSIFPAGVCAVNSRPLKAQRELFRGQVGVSVKSIGQRAPRQPLQARRIGSSALMTAASGAPAPVPSNKQALRREIFLERLVIIEMIAREIRENRDREMAAPQAVHCQRVRTGFQHRVRAARIADFREHLLQIERLGRGVHRRAAAPRRLIAGGADRPVVNPAACKIESTRNVVVVLPFVPVTPTSFSASAGRP